MHKLFLTLYKFGITLLLISFPYFCFATYEGPTLIVSVEWGSGTRQVGYALGDVLEFDTFPRNFLVDSDGSIIIPDQVNSKVLVYSSSGDYIGEFKSKDLVDDWEASNWPGFPLLLTDHTIISKPVNTLQKYDMSGNLIKSVQNITGRLIKALSNGTFLLRDQRNMWHIYSSLLVSQSNSAKQPEISKEGKLEITPKYELDENGSIEKSGYKITVTYPDKNYTLNIVPNAIESFYRDNLDTLFVTFTKSNTSISLPYTRSNGTEEIFHPTETIIQRYTETGELLDTIVLPLEPVDIYDETKVIYRPTIMYSHEPMFDYYGNIYIWSTDETHFNIHKWTRD